MAGLVNIQRLEHVRPILTKSKLVMDAKLSYFLCRHDLLKEPVVSWKNEFVPMAAKHSVNDSRYCLTMEQMILTLI